ncbi:MAG: PilN domain-containing protein, partial [Stellaceae bacterium]
VLDSAGREETLAPLDLSPDRLDDFRKTLAAARARVAGAAPGVTIRLPAEAALRTSMVLPLAAQSNLAQVVSFELDRRTPFKSDEIYFTHRLVKRDNAAQRLVVELTVVPCPVVDDAVGLASRLGLDLGVLEVASPEPRARPSGNLLPTRPQPLAARLPGFAIAGLSGLAAILACAVLTIPIYRAHRAAEALSAELAQVKRQADESLRLQKEIDAEIQESGFLGARKRQAVSASETIDMLTRLLPDDTYLTEMDLSNATMQISGIAASASGVLGLLDQSQRFTDAAFRSPVIQDQRTSREQFNISAKIAPRKAP